MCDVDHIIFRRMVSHPYDMIALETLNPAQVNAKWAGQKYRKMLGSRSPAELEIFIKYKAEDSGKIVVYVNPEHTSPKCSRSEYIDKNNRHSSAFRYRNCGFEFNANLNASRNVGVFGTSEYFRLFSADDRCGLMNSIHSLGETCNKLRSFSEE